MKTRHKDYNANKRAMSSQQNFHSKLFKPLVASTLALSLSSLAHATCELASNSSSPIFCHGIDKISSNTLKLKDSVSWKNEEGILAPIVNKNDYLKNINIGLSSNNSITNEINTGSSTYTIKVGNSSKYISFGYPLSANGGRGIKLGEDGSGMLTLELSPDRKFEANFRGNFEGSVTLKDADAVFDFSDPKKIDQYYLMKTGKIIFASKNNQNTKNNLVIKNAILSGDLELSGVKTNNTIDVSEGDTQTVWLLAKDKHGGIVNFKGNFNGGIGGDLHSAPANYSVTHPSFIVRFSEGSKMTGNIISLPKNEINNKFYDLQLRIIDFGSPDLDNLKINKPTEIAKDNFVLEGNITSTHALVNTLSEQKKENHGIHVIFYKGSMKGDITVEHPDYPDYKADKYDTGYVNVVFLENGARLKGNIFNTGSPSKIHKAESDIVFKGDLAFLESEQIRVSSTREYESSGYNNIYFENHANINAGEIISTGGKNIISIQQKQTTSTATTTTINLRQLTANTNEKDIAGINYIGKNLLDIQEHKTLPDTADKNLINNSQKFISGITTTLKNEKEYKHLDSSNTIAGTITINNLDKDAIKSYRPKALNSINVQNIKITGNIDADAGTNYIYANSFDQTGNITARWGGRNHIYIENNAINNNNKAIFSGIIKTDGSTDTSENLILFKNTKTTFKDAGIATLSRNDSGSKSTYISLDSTNNDITFRSINIKTRGGNYLAKNIISKTGGGYLQASTTTLDFTKDANAFTGKLYIKEGIQATNSGTNNIIYKADAKILPENTRNLADQTSIIGNVVGGIHNRRLDNAILGNNNVYLDLSANTDFANASDIINKVEGREAYRDFFQSAILGNIKNTSRETNNIYIKGGEKLTKIGFTGNIITEGGNNNIILDNSIWMPSAILIENTRTQMPLGGNASGNLINNNGIVNLVFRETNTGSLSQKGASLFGITTTGEKAQTNIVIKGNTNMGANINYSNSGIINFIFSNYSNQNQDNSDSFSANKTSTDGIDSKVLGTTYKDGIKLVLQDKIIKNNKGENISFINAYGHLFKSQNNVFLTLFNKRETITDGSSNENIGSKDTITIDGLFVGTVVALQRSDDNKSKTFNFDVTLKENAAFFGGFNFNNLTKKARTSGTTNDLNSTSITLTMEKGSNFFIDSSIALQNLIIKDTEIKENETLYNSFKQSNTIIDLGSYGNDNNAIATRDKFNLLSIGSVTTTRTGDTKTTTTGLEGSNALFRIYANTHADQNKAVLGATKAGGNYGYVYNDRIIIDSVKTTSDKPLKEYIQVLYDADINANAITYEKDKGAEIKNNIALLTVKNNDNGEALVDLEAMRALQGFDVIKTNLTSTTTDRYGKVSNGSKGYTTYFINSVETEGISLASEQSSTAAFISNYELYLANMNSLNKRMGELRNNANAQGAWARVFNGMQTSRFALETTSIYTTFQAGYDYAFGMAGANNYLGFAVAYNNALTESKTMLDLDDNLKGLKNSISNGVEFAVYNAYVQDGASKDTGFKNGLYTDTILKVSFINNKLNLNTQDETYNINNYAVTFSQEVGYRFLLGNAKEWFIDPQAELTLGFLDQSNLKQKLGTAFLDGAQSAILTLRGRIGSNFGYKFDKFTENKNFKSQLYVGTYFVGDYISGGDVALISDLGSTTALTPLNSTGRFTMNLGTNFAIKDNHRIYFDFERSFGGKVTTVYQVNLGYRYSFGENKKYMPYVTALTSDISKSNRTKTKK